MALYHAVFSALFAVMEGTRDVTPTVLKTSTGLEGDYNKCIIDCHRFRQFVLAYFYCEQCFIQLFCI